MPNERLKLTGAAILAFRASTSLRAAPAAEPGRSGTNRRQPATEGLRLATPTPLEELR
jgi:hypothetical protein